jgi:hypothetical protein
VLQCGENEQEDAGLCYTPCQAPSIGVGPICWGSCPNGTIECGAACLQPHVSCASYILGLIAGGVASIVDLTSGKPAADITTNAAIDFGALVTSLSLPVCPTF